MAGGVSGTNHWKNFFGGGNGVSGIMVMKKEFTAADLNFNVGFNDKIITNGQQGKFLVPVSIWGKVEFPSTGAALPNNIDADGYEIGLYSTLEQKMILLGIVNPQVFSTFFKNCYFPVPFVREDVFLNNHVPVMEALSLRIRPVNDDAGNNHTGGNYKLKFRVMYELLDPINFI